MAFIRYYVFIFAQPAFFNEGAIAIGASVAISLIISNFLTDNANILSAAIGARMVTVSNVQSNNSTKKLGEAISIKNGLCDGGEVLITPAA